MATIAPTHVTGHAGLEVFKWANAGNADTLTPAVPNRHSDVTVYFFGTFGGNCSLTGSPDPALAAGNFTTLHDALTGALIQTISAAAVRAVLDGAYAYLPVLGAGVTATDVWLVCRSK